MNRAYGDPIEVWTHDDGRPARFVWRGRLYTVLAVLGHTVISREAWRRQAREPDRPADREFWRVAASPGKDAPRGIFELRRDVASGDWLLARTFD